MEMSANLQLSIQKGDLVISLDLTDAYLHVPIHPSNSVSSALGCSSGLDSWVREVRAIGARQVLLAKYVAFRDFLSLLRRLVSMSEIKPFGRL